jgi:hypothetical protein
LLTARQIAEASGVVKGHVLADMKAGRFVDPIFGAGFFLSRTKFSDSECPCYKRAVSSVRAVKMPDGAPVCSMSLG